MTGTAGKVDPGNLDAPYLVMDWFQPSKPASNGCRYVAVIGWVQKKIAFGVPTKVKKKMSARALHFARIHWRIERERFLFHSDNEGVLMASTTFLNKR